MLQSKKQFKKGVVLYLTILILGLLFAIGIGLSLIVFTRIKMTREIGYSVNALCAADSGVERALYELYVNSISLPAEFSDNFDDASYTVGVFQSGAPNCPSSFFDFYCIQSLGEFKNTIRNVQAAY
jgi:hypothetical protein